MILHAVNKSDRTSDLWESVSSGALFPYLYMMSFLDLSRKMQYASEDCWNIITDGSLF